MPETISLAMARHLALYCQGLDGGWQPAPGKEGVAQTIERLGYVQLDTIHVVQRAHHHILWSRCPDYHPQMLHELLAEDRRIFEWWTHAASCIPISDYRFYAPRMGNRALSPRQKAWVEEHQAVMDRVLQRIREEGALGTSDFKPPEGFAGGSWWSGWKPSKRALEIYFNLGVLAVSERQNFQRLYDLKERVIPTDSHLPVPDREETEAYLLRRLLGTLGVVPESELYWWRRARPSQRVVEQAVDQGLVSPITVEGQDGEPWYAWTAALRAVSKASCPNGKVHVLSPFDNLIIRRSWMEKVFAGFDYRLECYLPREKRQYGYFALPILWGDRFIGRVDTKADRKTHTLLVRQLSFEPDFEAYEAVLQPLSEELWAFARFNACEDISVEAVTPERLKSPLVAQIQQAGPPSG